MKIDRLFYSRTLLRDYHWIYLPKYISVSDCEKLLFIHSAFHELSRASVFTYRKPIISLRLDSCIVLFILNIAGTTDHVSRYITSIEGISIPLNQTKLFNLFYPIFIYYNQLMLIPDEIKNDLNTTRNDLNTTRNDLNTTRKDLSLEVNLENMIVHLNAISEYTSHNSRDPFESKTAINGTNNMDSSNNKMEVLSIKNQSFKAIPVNKNNYNFNENGLFGIIKETCHDYTRAKNIGFGITSIDVVNRFAFDVYCMHTTGLGVVHPQDDKLKGLGDFMYSSGINFEKYPIVLTTNESNMSSIPSLVSTEIKNIGGIDGGSETRSVDSEFQSLQDPKIENPEDDIHVLRADMLSNDDILFLHKNISVIRKMISIIENFEGSPQ